MSFKVSMSGSGRCVTLEVLHIWFEFSALIPYAGDPAAGSFKRASLQLCTPILLRLYTLQIRPAAAPAALLSHPIQRVWSQGSRFASQIRLFSAVAGEPRSHFYKLVAKQG